MSSPELSKPKDWSTVCKARILFGHQSVGENIIAGIEHLKKNSVRLQDLNISEITKTTPEGGPGLFHFRVGKNRNPEEKISHFAQTVREIGTTFDVALMKFCYVDVSSESDAQAIANKYLETVKKLNREFPNLILLHTTVPLTTHSGGIRTHLKYWLKGDQENIQRHHFNSILRREYSDTGTLIDIAKEESTKAAGARCEFTFRAKQFEALAPEYTYDGGHLNEKGASKVAVSLLDALANCLVKRRNS